MHAHFSLACPQRQAAGLRLAVRAPHRLQEAD